MSGSGKGDKPRPFDRKKWDAGWERAFGKKKRQKRRKKKATR